MLFLDENQKKADFNDRVKRFQADLVSLSENYKLMLQPTLHVTNNGIIPVLSINDTKYASVSSKESPQIIFKEQSASNKEGVENGKETLEGDTTKRKK